MDKRFAERRIGLERCKGAYAWQSLLKAGVRIAFKQHQGDFPARSLNP
jgi:predicted amidohydrolase YtcJ